MGAAAGGKVRGVTRRARATVKTDRGIHIVVAGNPAGRKPVQLRIAFHADTLTSASADRTMSRRSPGRGLWLYLDYEGVNRRIQEL